MVNYLFKYDIGVLPQTNVDLDLDYNFATALVTISPIAILKGIIHKAWCWYICLFYVRKGCTYLFS